MDYKEKYKEALNRAKAMIKVADKQEEVYRTIITLFPELAESEDEKIRKEIIDYIKIGTYKKGWIDWLEKQGKEEYALKSFKDEDVRKFMQYIEKQAKIYEFNLPHRGYDIYAFAKDILAWLEKQGEKGGEE